MGMITHMPIKSENVFSSHHLPLSTNQLFIGLSISRFSNAYSLQHPLVPFRHLPTYASNILIERDASQESRYRCIEAGTSNQNKGSGDPSCQVHQNRRTQCSSYCNRSSSTSHRS